MPNPLASIIVPHYNTPVELNLCLACLAHYTREPAEILVIDNGSTQEVLDQLALPPGGRLLSRQQTSLDMSPHKAALDLGVEHSRGQFIVAMHSDAFVLRPDWLSFLMGLLEPPYVMAGPSTHKLQPPTLRRRIERIFATRKSRAPMIRPLFAIYRREIFEGARFSDFDDVGGISVEPLRSGNARTIGADIAARYVFHLGGITRLANLQHRRTARRKKARQFSRLLAMPAIRAVPRQVE